MRSIYLQLIYRGGDFFFFCLSQRKRRVIEAPSIFLIISTLYSMDQAWETITLFIHRFLFRLNIANMTEKTPIQESKLDARWKDVNWILSHSWALEFPIFLLPRKKALLFKYWTNIAMCNFFFSSREFFTYLFGATRILRKKLFRKIRVIK